LFATTPALTFSLWRISAVFERESYSSDLTFSSGSWLWPGPWSWSPGAHLACWVDGN